MTSEERRVPPTARIAEFPQKAAEQARWWEGHILEVLHGLPPDAPHGAVPRPEFDPRQHCLAERERAKAAELAAAGHRMTASGVKQRRQRCQRDGLIGLADGRSAKKLPDFGQISPLVVEAMRQAITEMTDASSRTVRFTIWRTKEILASREDADGIELPTERTPYRLFDKLAVGTHATGSARTRRSLQARPAGPFGEVPAVAPGELMQIDSTPLDVLIRLDDGIAEKVELRPCLRSVGRASVWAPASRPLVAIRQLSSIAIDDRVVDDHLRGIAAFEDPDNQTVLDRNHRELGIRHLICWHDGELVTRLQPEDVTVRFDEEAEEVLATVLHGEPVH
ncbi:hypothetical protein ACH5AP_22645 [Streptomyces anulatus]